MGTPDGGACGACPSGQVPRIVARSSFGPVRRAVSVRELLSLPPGPIDSQPFLNMIHPASLCIVFAVLAALPSQERQFELDQARAPAPSLPYAGSAFVCGDVDGDGRLDILTAIDNSMLQTASLVLHRGTQTGWQTETITTFQGLGSGLPQVQVAMVDLDGDGDLDLQSVVSFPGAAWTEVVHWRNDGAGSFASTAPIVWSGVLGAEVACGDLDGDGDRDLVVARTSAVGQVLPPVAMLHDGAFGFQQVAGILPAVPVARMVFGDLDGDHDQDLVAITPAGEVLVWWNSASLFAGGLVWSGTARAAVIEDFDGDGALDVLIQRQNGAIDLLRRTMGGFVAEGRWPGGVIMGGQPAAADFDGDGDVDGAVLVDGELRVLRNDGAANFAVEPICGANGLALGDVDGDGRLDVVFRVHSNVLAAAFGRADRMLYDPILSTRRYTAYATAGNSQLAKDLDRNGRVDWIQHAQPEGTGMFLVRRNLGLGRWSTVALQPVVQPSQIVAIDVDGDGDEDLVTVGGYLAGGIQVFRHDPGFQFTALAVQPFASAWIAGAADFTGDGLVDLLVGTGTNTLRLLRSMGTGAFAAPQTVTSNSVQDAVPGIWDIDADGDLDLLVVAGSNWATWLLNDGQGNFAPGNLPTVTGPAGWTSLRRMLLLDIDRDGDPDLFTWGYGVIHTMLNANNTFIHAQITNAAASSALVRPLFADWDGDGDADLLLVGSTTQLFLNAGNGRLDDFTAARLGHTNFRSVVAADFDGDGDVDPLGEFGTFQAQRINHLRSATALTPARLGGQLEVRFANEPGYAAAPAACLPVVAFAPRAVPLAVPGLRGTWQLDPNSAIVLPLLSLPSPTGTAVLQIAIPPVPGLVGLELYIQGILLGSTAGFSPGIAERIMPW